MTAPMIYPIVGLFNKLAITQLFLAWNNMSGLFASYMNTDSVRREITGRRVRAGIAREGVKQVIPGVLGKQESNCK